MAKFDDIIRFLNEAYSDVPAQTPSVAPKAPVDDIEEDDGIDGEDDIDAVTEPASDVVDEDEVVEPTDSDIAAMPEQELSDDDLSADIDDIEGVVDDDSVFGDDEDISSDDATGEVRSELGIEPEVSDEEDQIGRSSLENAAEDREKHNERVREKFKAWRDSQREPKDYGM